MKKSEKNRKKKKRKKIAFILPSLEAGGAERVTLSIIKALDRNKYAPVLIALNSKGPLRREIPSGTWLYTLDCERLRYSIFRLVRLLRELRPDCIFSTLGHINFAILILKPLLRARVIIRESSTPSRFLGSFPAFKARLYKLLYRLLYPRADLIIAQCDNMRKDLIKHFGIKPAKIVRIYNPVDIDAVLSKADMFIPREYAAGNLNIVAVGRMVEAKAYDLLIKAFCRLLKHRPDARLFIIGDGPLRKELIELCSRLGLEERVTLLGFLENPYPYIKHADLYVLSSRWEGFPNTLLEALVCGVKVVATDCESGPKEILGAESYGLLARVDDENSLCEKMLQCINMPSKTGTRGRDFGLEKIIGLYQKAFDRVLS